MDWSPGLIRRMRTLAIVAPLLLSLAAARGPDTEEQQAFQREYDRGQAILLTDARKSEAHAVAARALAGRVPNPAAALVDRAHADWLRSEARIAQNQPAEGAAIAGAALRSLAERPEEATLTGDLLRSRGFAEAMLGRVEEALSDFQRAYSLFGRSGETRRQALTLQDIGAIYSDAGDTVHTLRYYRQSAELGAKDLNVQLAAHHNIGLVLGKMGRTREAQAELLRALAAARALHSASFEARVLTELAESQMQSGDLADAGRAIERARLLTQTDPSVAGWRPLVLGVEARLELAQGRLPAAGRSIRAALQGVDLRTTDLSYRDLHETAVKVFRAQGEDRLALANLEALKRLDDASQMLASNTNAALMSARFDFQNQDLRIARLQSRQLQQAVQLEQARIRLHRTIFLGSALLGGSLLLLMGIALRNARRSQRQIRAVNAELSASNTALERALKVKTEFLATTSHEIRTPLNGILGMTQVMLAERRLEPPLRERIEVVHSAGQTMRALVDDILDVAKLESGRVELMPAPTSLSAIFADASRLWGAEAARKGLHFEAGLQDAPEQIVADEQRLRQILFNLLSNAIKFTDAGRVAMVATVLGGPDAEMLKITVDDTGIGIAPELHEAIFESFRQADGGTTRRYGGTGLGLTICRRLAAAMDGTVTVESEAGKGARFSLRVPLARAAADPPARRCPEDPTSLDCSRVLLLDRNPLTRGIQRALLEPACREVLVAGSVEEAGGLVETAGVDLVLADAGSLGAEPEEVARGISALAPVPVVLLAPGPQPQAELAFAAAGAAQIVAKPVSGSNLLARLRSLYEGVDVQPA